MLSSRSLVVGVLLVAASSACSSSNIPRPMAAPASLAAAASQQRALQSTTDLERQVLRYKSVLGANRRLSNKDRAMLLGMFLRGPAWQRPHATVKNTVLAMAEMDAHGHIVRQFSNRPGFMLSAKKVGSFQWHASVPPATSLIPAVDYTPHPGTGPYHQLITQDSYTAEPQNGADVTLPCSGFHIPFGDEPYIYLGGFTDEGDTSSIESGEQFNKGGLTVSARYQPYIKYAGESGESGYPGNAQAVFITQETGAGSDGHWYCPITQVPIYLYQYFFSYVSVIGTGTPIKWVTVFTNISVLNDYSEIEYGILLSGNGWKGWLPDTCPDCHFIQTTSIAQPSDQKGNGAFFGPDTWSNMNAGGSTAPVPYTDCINYPIWEGNECGNTPPSPLNTVIEISDQTLTGSSPTETVIINNSSG